jgi:hypothetical protein
VRVLFACQPHQNPGSVDVAHSPCTDRYWSTLIWSNLFETLLNVRDCTVPSKELTSSKAQLAQELQGRFSRHGLRLQACCRALVAGLKASHKKKAPAVARRKKQNNK